MLADAKLASYRANVYVMTTKRIKLRDIIVLVCDFMVDHLKRLTLNKRQQPIHYVVCFHDLLLSLVKRQFLSNLCLRATCQPPSALYMTTFSSEAHGW